MKIYKSIYYTLISALLALCSCDNMFEYHPYSIKIGGRRNINMQNIELLESAELKPPFKFAFITDTQGSYDETKAALKSMAQRGDIDFIIHGGDVSDFGLPKEFIWCRDIFETVGIPYVAIIGNHDCLGNGKDTFEYIFGKSNYSFNIGRTHFLCLNTNALEYDHSNPTPNLDFIENDRIATNTINENNPDSITHTVVIMHAKPYDDQFNNNVAKPFNYYISLFPGMNETDGNIEGSDNELIDGTRAKAFCINGHNHSEMVSDIFNNGILYYQCPNAGKREYFIFTITTDGYEWEAVKF